MLSLEFRLAVLSDGRAELPALSPLVSLIVFVLPLSSALLNIASAACAVKKMESEVRFGAG